MKATSALLALGVCLAMSAPSARAEAVDWKFGTRYFPQKPGYVWNGAFQDAAVAVLEAGDYAAFQALTNGFNDEQTENKGKWTRYKTGWSGKADANQLSFLDPQDSITFLYFDNKDGWTGENCPDYYIVEKPTEGYKYDETTNEKCPGGKQVMSGNTPDAFTTHGTVGQAVVATDPTGLPLDGFDPAVLNNGSATGTVVTCTAPAEIVYGSAHYTNLDQVAVQTWETNGTPHAWSAPETNDAPGRQFVYTKGESPAKITWLYKRDGWQLALSVDPPNSGTVTTDPVPNLGSDPSFVCYTDDTQITLTVTPASDGFLFRGWKEGTNALDTSATYTVTMDQARTVQAVFESVPLTWNGGVDNVWTNGGAGGWLAADNTPTNWSNGARAVFKNPDAADVVIAEEGVTATSVKFEGAAVNLTGGALTMMNDAAITAKGQGVAVAIDAPIAGTDGLTVSANAAEKSFVIGKPATFTGALAIQSGRVEFGEEGKLGADGMFAGAVTLAKNTVLATPPCPQTFNGQISGQGKVLVQNAEGATTSSVSFADAAWTGGLTVGTNGFVEAKADKGLPNAGTVKAVDGGELKLSCQGPGIWGRKVNEIYVCDGGILNIANYTAIRGLYYDKRKLHIENNGILKLTCGRDPMMYFLEVTNGGIIEEEDGSKILLGDIGNNIEVNVKGNAPFLQKAGYSWQSPMNFTMDVADVTENDAGDMLVSGSITGDAHYEIKNKQGTITDSGSRSMIKKGAGTVVFSGENTYSNCITRIDEGTLRFDTDSAMGIGTNTDTRIVLNGDGAEGKICVLDIGTNANKVCALGLEQKGGTLKLGEGGSIEFAASGALDWGTTNAFLWIEGELGKETVRFGTDTNGLTTAQIDKIKLNGESKPLHLDAAGWLCGNPAGTAIILR